MAFFFQNYYIKHTQCLVGKHFVLHSTYNIILSIYIYI